MIHETSFKIRTFHVDAFGHVNNSKYLELLEESRWRFAEDIGLIGLLADANLGFIIIEMNVKFRQPTLEGETILVETSLVELGSSSGEVRQTVKKENKSTIALKSTYHFILIDRATGKSVAIENEIRDLLLGITQR